MDLQNKRILSLCGGGIRGIVHLGVIKYLEEIGVLKNITIFAGTSIGAIIVGLIVLGYNASEIFDFNLKLDFTKLFHFNNIGNIIQHYGFDNGCRFDYIFDILLIKKGYNTQITLNELYTLTNKKLIVTTTCLSNNEAVYIDHLNYPNMPLKMALRMSACVPLLMTPISYENKLYIDGGCSIPIPLSIFEKKEEILAINLVYSDDVSSINNLETFIQRVIKLMYNHLYKNSITLYEECVVNVVVDTFFIDMDLTEEKKTELFLNGYNKMVDLFVSK